MNTTKEISNSDDIIDSRDVIARIEELHDIATDESLDSDERTHANNELAVLQALQEEAEGYAPDWKHGAALIRDSYFKEYAQELADDIGAINSEATWPNNCIDWDRAARELQMDYTSVEFDGVTYWVR
jgi:hypothetical protein